MVFRLVGRSALILLPLITGAARVHLHTVNTPLGVTQEVNRCLVAVRVATSRRRHSCTAAPTRQSIEVRYRLSEAP
jgi:hypothetical protein